MRKVIWILTFLAAFSARSSHANQTLSEITVGASGSLLFAKFLDSPQIDKFSVKAYPGYFQISMPNTTALNSGEFVEGDKEKVLSVAPFQISPNKSVVRIYTARNFNPVDMTLPKLSLKGNTLHVSITWESESPVARIAKNIPVKDIKIAQNVFTGIDQSHLVRFAMASIFVLLGFLGFLTLRRIRRNKMLLSGGADYTQLSMINQLHMSPKVRLCLVKLGSEQLLLSVSPEGASLITKISSYPNSSSANVLESKKVTLPKATSDARAIGPHADKRAFEKILSGKLGSSAQGVEPKLKASVKAVNKAAKKKVDPESGSIDEITSIIRNKLKSLPKI